MLFKTGNWRPKVGRPEVLNGVTGGSKAQVFPCDFTQWRMSRDEGDRCPNISGTDYKMSSDEGTMM